MPLISAPLSVCEEPRELAAWPACGRLELCSVKRYHFALFQAVAF